MKLNLTTIGFIFCSIFLLNGCISETEDNRDLKLWTNLDDRNQYSNVQLLKQNITTTIRIQGLRKNDTTDNIFLQAETVRKRSQEVVDFINGLRVTLIEKTGGYTENKDPQKYVGILNKTIVTEIMIGKNGDKDGMGYYLKQKVNGCITDFNKLKKTNSGNTISPYRYLAVDAIDDVTCIEPNYKRYDFAEYNFKDATLIIALTELSQMENSILQMETDLLYTLLEKHLKQKDEI